MKTLSAFLFALVLVFGVVGIKNTAYADNWFLSPSGPVDTSGNFDGDPVSVDLYLNYTGDMSAYFTGIDLSFNIDITEVTPKLDKVGLPDVTWIVLPPVYIPVIPPEGTLRIAAGSLSGYSTWAVGLNHVATINLELVNPAGRWDGDDVTLLAQVGMSGIADYYGNIVQYGSADGPDYGSVPIPSAIWLLGSGLIGVLGFREKFRKEA